MSISGQRNPLKVYLDVPGLCHRQALRAIENLQPGAERFRTSVLALTLLLTGVVGDATTTLIALRTGLGEEANPAVLALGSVVGLELYLLATAVLCIFIAFPVLGKPDHPYGYLISAGCVVILLAKLFLTFSNTLVLTGHGSLL